MNSMEVNFSDSPHGIDQWLAITSAENQHLVGFTASRCNLESVDELFDKLEPTQVKRLDVSENQLTTVPESFLRLKSLVEFDAHANCLGKESCSYHDDKCDCVFGFPEAFTTNADLPLLQNLNLGANELRSIPHFIMSLKTLNKLHLGGNRISHLPPSISMLKSLEYLYLGGNQLTDIPEELADLTRLVNLNLSDNLLKTIPSKLGELTNLRCLALNSNHIVMLPMEIVKLKNLEVLSLRNNPLVIEFVQNECWKVPTLMELSGRVAVCRLQQTGCAVHELNGVASWIRHYLDSARSCENPSCCGVYFSAFVEDVKFTDFCGKYRLPLLQFLCSPRCSSDVPCCEYPTSAAGLVNEVASTVSDDRIRRVLLG